MCVEPERPPRSQRRQSHANWAGWCERYCALGLWCPARRGAIGETFERERTVRMYNACMPNVQIREVPDDVHAALVRRAELAGQSLQQYLAAQLAAIVATPTIDEMIARIEGRPKGRVSRASAIAALQDERARR